MDDPFPEGRDVPFHVALSFAPLVASLRARRAHAQPPERAVIDVALTAYDEARPLREAEADGGVSEAVARDHREAIAALLAAAAPDAVAPDAALALIPPYSRWAAAATPTFTALDLLGGTWDTLLDASGPLAAAFGAEGTRLGPVQSAYLLALRELAEPGAIGTIDGRADPAIPSVAPVRDPETGLLRAFSVHADTRYCAVRRTDPSATPLSAATVRDLLAHRGDVARWEAVIPPGSVVIEGVVLLRAVETTAQTARAALYDALARETGPLTAAALTPYLQAVYGDPSLAVSLVALDPEAGRAVRSDLDLTVATRAPGGPPSDPRVPLLTWASERPRPTLLTDLGAAEVPPGVEPAVTAYREQGARSLAVAPVGRPADGAGPLALLVATSGRVGTVHAFNARPLADAATASAELIARRMAADEDRLQSTIRRLYTALHPTVDWRFRRAARAHLAAHDRGEAASPEAIVFHGVHAVWGQADVRGSTALRLAAVRADAGSGGGREHVAAYERGMARLNAALAAALAETQDDAQREVPHVLRPTVTDGVEYDGYVGPSLVAEPVAWAGPEALERLWRWQIGLHLRLERAAHEVDVPDGLRVAHLVLFHAAPLDVRFRTDELRLDVDGPAHAYVEVVKKRIEKAHAADGDGRPTTERLSQPGQLTVVCTSWGAEQAARRLVVHSVAAGDLQEPEPVHVEPLDGVDALYAFRTRFGGDAL